jgi:hypothetical protein
MLWQLMSTGGVPHSGGIIVLGAGAGRDLPLDYLAATFDRIVLVDLSRTQMEFSLAYVPEDVRHKVSLVEWDITGALGSAIESIARSWPSFEKDSSGTPDIRALAFAIELLSKEYGGILVPEEISRHAPYSMVVSDLVTSQLAQKAALDIAQASQTGLDQLFAGCREPLSSIAGVLNRQHASLLYSLCRPGGSVIVLEDTMMLGRNPDGSEALFNKVVAERGLDINSLTLSEVDDCRKTCEVLGSDFDRVLSGTDSTLVLEDRSFWWWPHCAVKSYLVIAYRFKRRSS